MQWIRTATMMVVLLGGVPGLGAQSRVTHKATEVLPESATRYFELKLVMRYPGAPGREPRVESLMTDIAVIKDRPGASSCRARVTSQVPVMMQKGPTYLDLGTKLDCNDVRVEGNAVAMAVVLETSSVNGMVTTRDKDGQSLEEPLISQRNLQLQARLPLGKPTVIFDTKNMEPMRLKPLKEDAGAVAGSETDGMRAPAEMQVEMTARELP